MLFLPLAASCAEPRPPPPRPATVIPAATREARPRAATPAPPADAGSDGEAEPERRVRFEYAIAPGASPCTFVFGATVMDQTDIGRYLMGIDRIETEAGGTCHAGLVYDAAAEVARDPDQPEYLEGGVLPNPGKLEAAAADADSPPPIFVDANFDGFLDLTAVAMTGAYNRGFRFWLFDPATKRFVTSPELDDLLMPRFDAKRKRVEAGGRAGGPVYVGSEHEWVAGKLETVRSQTTYLGETPKGGPLPAGFTQWQVRNERRGGVLKKVFDGPAR